jgi:hypothetical protein
MTKFFKTPPNRLPVARGGSEHKFDHTFRFGKRDLVANVNDKYSHYLGGILKQAVLKPGKWVRRWFEENGYQYEDHAKYDPKTNTIQTNDICCPSVCWHHVGSTCGVCGQKD